MAWQEWLINEMIPGAALELADLNNSINGITDSKTHWEHWQAIYQGIQGVAKNNLEIQLVIKKAGFTAGTHQAAWQPNHSYTLGSYARPTTPNGYVYQVILPDPGPGTSGGSEPTWPTTPGQTIVDNEITWKCYTATIDIVYGPNYNVSNISDWTIRDNPGSIVVYQYQGTGWDNDAIIIKAISDWNICYDLLTDNELGANNMITRLGQALTIITDQRDLIAARNLFLGDYD